MGSGKEGEPLNPKEMMKMKKPSRLGPKAPNPKSKFNNKKKKLNNIDKKKNKNDSSDKVGAKKPKPQAEPISPSQQLNFFLDQFQSANNLQLSSLESDSLTEACVLDLSQVLDQEVSTLGKQVKAAFGPSWKEVLCEGQLMEGKIDPGNPAVLIISASALRSLEFLRGLRPLTRECPAAKLFSKHMKVDDQVSILKNRVNIASGTPSRIKKLIDVEALGLSRLSIIVLDMHTDVKGYSLFTLPQVREEFWDLYKNYFHQRLLQGDTQICLFGRIPIGTDGKKKQNKQVSEQ